MKEYSRKPIDILKNSAKEQIIEAAVKVKQICENLKRIIRRAKLSAKFRTKLCSSN